MPDGRETEFTFGSATVRTLSLPDYRQICQRFPAVRGSAQYGRGWLYLTQACRNAGAPYGAFGALVDDGTSVAGLGRHNQHWVVVRPLGALDEGFVGALIELVRSTDAPLHVYVKMADSGPREQLRRAAIAHGAAVLGATAYRWDTGSPHDDQTFGEVVMPVRWTSELAHSQGEAARKIRAKVRQCYRAHGVPEFTTVEAIGQNRVMDMLARHFGADHSYVASYANMVAILGAPDAADTWWHFVPVVDGEPVGLFAYERVDDTSAAVYASVAHHRFTGLGEAMMVEMAERMRRQGFLLANLGGSEKETLHRYKLKFSAGLPARRRHAMFVLDVRRDSEQTVPHAVEHEDPFTLRSASGTSGPVLRRLGRRAKRTTGR